MIIVLKNGVGDEEITALVKTLIEKGATTEVVKAGKKLIIANFSGAVDEGLIAAHRAVEQVVRTDAPYKLAKSAKGVFVGDKKFGAVGFEIIAGPCSVESRRQILSTAKLVKEAGATMLRGGAFKPRTSPYSFSGLGLEGLEMLSEAKKLTGLKVVSEITSASQIEYFSDVDVLQVGARNMQNYELLHAVGLYGKPVLLKRGFMSTVDEWLLSAEHILNAGNENVILCERGTRAAVSVGGTAIDFGAVIYAKQETGLPVVVDPSHSSLTAEQTMKLALAAAAVGADGVMIETHVDPENALSDGRHQLTPDQLAATIKAVNGVLSGIKGR